MADDDNQGELFAVENHDGRQNWRNSDPVTSKWAGVDMEASGASGRQRQKFHKMVKLYQGRTARELAGLIEAEEGFVGEFRSQASRRLPELERDKLIYKGAPRRCTDGGRMCVTWWPR